MILPKVDFKVGYILASDVGTRFMGAKVGRSVLLYKECVASYIVVTFSVGGIRNYLWIVAPAAH